MCGIVGIIDFSGKDIDPVVLIGMRDRMQHRGPDDYGAVLLNDSFRRTSINKSNTFIKFRNIEDLAAHSFSPNYSIGLAHRRLSIVDLSESGRQPMCNEDASIWITYNGEVYNFGGIRKELEAAGHVFRSKTDTEVILHAYEEWGMGCLDRFIGMFAFAIWDGRDHKLALVRDRVGVKPLYYCTLGSRLLFASEIKAILDHPGIDRKVDEDAFYHYLSFHCVPPPGTLFKGIYKLEAGHYLVIRDVDNMMDVPYWNMFKRRNEGTMERPDEDVCQEILELFRDATRLRMISDVPFGAFLSGGIDSSLNVAVMSQILEQPVNTFSIGFEGAPEFNEFHWAKQVAKQFGTNHHEVTISAKDTISFLSRLVYYQDEPISDPACVPVYFLSKLAKDHGVTVCQVGEGSDELFCGYPIWLDALRGYSQTRHLVSKLRNFPILAASYIASHFFDFAWGVYDRCLPFWGQEEIFWGGAVDYRDHQKRAILSPTFQSASTRDLLFRYRKHFEDHCYAPDDLSWMTYLDLRLRIPELLLMRMDKLSMAASVEGRVPFLDHRLVELVLSLPQKQKVDGSETKYLLKKAIRGIIPDSIIDRPKQGFQLPVSRWYIKYLHDAFQRTMDDFLKDTDYFNSKALRRFTARKGIPWIVINFILWHRMWIDQTDLV